MVRSVVCVSVTVSGKVCGECEWEGLWCVCVGVSGKVCGE